MLRPVTARIGILFRGAGNHLTENTLAAALFNYCISIHIPPTSCHDALRLFMSIQMRLSKSSSCSLYVDLLLSTNVLTRIFGR